MMYSKIGRIKNHWRQNLALEFCRNQNKDINILTESHMNDNQIHYIRSNWLDPIFFSPGKPQKNFSCFSRVTLITLIQKGGLCPLRLLSLKTEFCAFMPLQSIAPGISWLRDVSLNDYKIIWKIKIRKMKKKKKILSDFNCIMDKMDRKGRNKTENIYRCSFNYALSKVIVDNGPRILWVYPLWQSLWHKISRIDSVYTDIKIASNTKIN